MILLEKEELKEYFYKLINESKIELNIISPFVDFFYYENIWTELIELFVNKKGILEIYADVRNINKIIKTNEEYNFIKKEKIFPVKDVHSKIYMNEKAVLLTSMNLTYSSFKKSEEFGIYYSKKDNEDEYNKVVEYYNRKYFQDPDKYNNQILERLRHHTNNKFNKYLFGNKEFINEKQHFIAEKNGKKIICNVAEFNEETNKYKFKIIINNNSKKTEKEIELINQYDIIEELIKLYEEQ